MNDIAKQMIQLRKNMLLVNQKYIAGEFKIPIHLEFGHEAFAVSLFRMMTPEDRLILSHRNCAHNLLREDFDLILKEYLMKAEGLAGGKLGSMNLSTPRKGIPYSSSILGNNFGVAVGISLAKKIRGEKDLTVVLTGDGASEEGSFYESLVLAQAKKLSCLFVVENNGWSMSSSIDQRRDPLNLQKYAESNGILFEQFESNNVFEYVKRLKEIRRECVEKSRPLLLEVKLSTLGYYYNEEGRMINYHAGPARKLSSDLIIMEDASDPLFVLKKEGYL